MHLWLGACGLDTCDSTVMNKGHLRQSHPITLDSLADADLFHPGHSNSISSTQKLSSDSIDPNFRRPIPSTIKTLEVAQLIVRGKILVSSKLTTSPWPNNEALVVGNANMNDTRSNQLQRSNNKSPVASTSDLRA